MDKEQIQQHVEKVGMELSNANNLTGYARIAAITSIEFQAQEWLQQSLSIIEHQQREIARLNEIDERECGFITKLRDQLADKDKEIEFLRMQRESLETQLQHYRGYQ